MKILSNNSIKRTRHSFIRQLYQNQIRVCFFLDRAITRKILFRFKVLNLGRKKLTGTIISYVIILHLQTMDNDNLQFHYYPFSFIFDAFCHAHINHLQFILFVIYT